MDKIEKFYPKKFYQMNLDCEKDIKIISIDANISGGKSTILEKLERDLSEKSPSDRKIIFLKEPLEEWQRTTDSNGKNILQHFYEDKVKNAYLFQSNALYTRYRKLKECIDEICHQQKTSDKNVKYIIITERTITTDFYIFASMLYESGCMSEIEFKIYTNWYNDFKDIYPIYKYFYLKVDPKICHSRICNRARAGEENIPLEYLEMIDKKHEFLFGKILPEKKCFIIENNCNLSDSSFNDIVKIIKNMICTM